MKKVTIPQQAVVFGSDRIASIWALRNKVPRDRVILATHPDQVEELEGPVTVVRVSEEQWKATTFPDEKRIAQTEKLLKTHGKKNEIVEDKLE